MYAIAAADPLATVQNYVSFYDISYPVLFDQGGQVHSDYSQQNAFGGTIYPDDWIIGIDGKVAYVHNGYDPEAMVAVIEAELAKKNEGADAGN